MEKPSNCLQALPYALFLWLFCLTDILFASPDTATQHRMLELQFYSAKRYANPHTNGNLWCTFRLNDSTSIRIGGFWDGDTVRKGSKNAGLDTIHIFKIRFAAPHPGTWTWTTSCTDSTNTALHKQSGTMQVRAYTGNNVLYQKGFLRVAAHRRALAYGDGSPFFYLGDTAWEMTWRSTMDEVRQYISTRKAQGFTAVQLVAMQHLGLLDEGVINQNGEPFFTNKNFLSPNPRYFAYMDSIVTMLNDSGLVAVIVPAWSRGMTESTHLAWRYERFLPNAAVLQMGRYAAARYAGHHVLWIAAGDDWYNRDEQKVFWAQFARTIQETDGQQHLMTLHSAGYTASFDFFPNSASWLDFQTYQSSHDTPSNAPRTFAARGYALSPVKPVLNAEPIYEDITVAFWNERPNPPRASAENVRTAAYSSILSGALVGVSYGADGIWQWNSRRLPSPNLNPRFPVDSALRFPGARQMGILRDIMERYAWQSLEPAPLLVSAVEPSSVIADVASNEHLILAYLQRGITKVSLETRQIAGMKFVRWHNPADGTVSAFQALPRLPSIAAFSPPSLTQDWLLVITGDTSQTGRTTIANPSNTLSFNALEACTVFPQPAHSGESCTVECTLRQGGRVRIELFSMLGNEVATHQSDYVPSGRQRVTMRLPRLPSGAYLLHLTAEAGEAVFQSALLLVR